MYKIKEACELVDMNYETLKYYCNQGLVPNLERDENNYPIFTDKNISWIKGLKFLKRCNMSISDMKIYVELCKKGESSIPQRQKMLDKRKRD